MPKQKKKAKTRRSKKRSKANSKKKNLTDKQLREEYKKKYPYASLKTLALGIKTQYGAKVPTFQEYKAKRLKRKGR